MHMMLRLEKLQLVIMRVEIHHLWLFLKVYFNIHYISILDGMFLQSWCMCQISWFVSLGSSFQLWGKCHSLAMPISLGSNNVIYTSHMFLSFLSRLGMFAGMIMMCYVESQLGLLEHPLVICQHLKMPAYAATYFCWFYLYFSCRFTLVVGFLFFTHC